jgi:hypothetical protein
MASYRDLPIIALSATVERPGHEDGVVWRRDRPTVRSCRFNQDDAERNPDEPETDHGIRARRLMIERDGQKDCVVGRSGTRSPMVVVSQVGLD